MMVAGKASPFLPLFMGFVAGAMLLSVVSTIQKFIAGYNPLLPKGYIVPILFGGLSGSVIAWYSIKLKKLNESISHRLNTLEAILPICSFCKKIRTASSDPDAQALWKPIESYISERTESSFSHGLCPDCLEKHYGKDFLSRG